MTSLSVDKDGWATQGGPSRPSEGFGKPELEVLVVDSGAIIKGERLQILAKVSSNHARTRSTGRCGVVELHTATGSCTTQAGRRLDWSLCGNPFVQQHQYGAARTRVIFTG